MQNARNISLQPITTRATTSAEIKQLGLPLITFEKDLPRMDEPDALTPRAWPPWTVCVRWWCSSGRLYGTVYLTVRGLSVILPMTILSLKEHRSQISCADGRASTRHLHGRTARAARCATVKVASAGTSVRA